MKYPAIAGAKQLRAKTNGIELDYLEAGPPDGELVVLLHGFPESLWSWRHQVPALAAAGYRVVAPDQRGYGGSSKPREVDAYSSDQLQKDALGLVDAVTGKPGSKAVFVGHDWGALLVWDLVRENPDRVRAAVAVSVPYTPWPAPPTAVLKAMVGDKFHYILYFQTVGPAETEMDADKSDVLRKTIWGVSGDMPRGPAWGTQNDVLLEGGKLADTMQGIPDGLPPFVTEEDFATWKAAYDESGFFGPVSWYRNLDRNYERTKSIPASVVSFPVFFIGSEADMVLAGRATEEAMDAVHKDLPGYKGAKVLPKAGHWTQQEIPAEFNRELLAFLKSLPPASA
ncbi:putative epoxide hydrolase [Hyaloraphidium curvatum]|nr:putative epoxide hydrolase [Hyaloraphidium curvatum]